MNNYEIKKYIATLLNVLDLENAKLNRIIDFIERLKEHDVTDDTEEHYREIKKRDKYLKEEIDIFLLNVGGTR